MSCCNKTLDGEETLDESVTISENLEVGGIVKLADGTASAPSLTYTNDTNTGLFRSSADTLNISTGGTERVEIDATSMNVNVPLSLDSTSSTALSVGNELTVDTSSSDIALNSSTASITLGDNLLTPFTIGDGGATYLTINTSTGAKFIDISQTLTTQTITSEGITIDSTNTEALLVRKNGDSGDIFTVDTSTETITSAGQFIGKNNYRAKVYLSTNQLNLTSGAFTKIQFDTAEYDPNSDFDLVTDYDYTVPLTGIYYVCLNVAFTATTTNQAQFLCEVDRNGSRIDIAQAFKPASVTNDVHLLCSATHLLTAGDLLTFNARQDTGLNTVDLSSGNGGDGCFVSIIFLGN